MKNRWALFVCSLIWIVAAVCNAFAGRNFAVVGLNLFAAVLFAGLGILLTLSEKTGKPSPKAMRGYQIAALIIAILCFVMILFLEWSGSNTPG